MAQNDYSDKELEKLLEIASQKSKSEITDFKKTDVERFIDKFQIEAGDTFVHNVIIYYTYWKSKQRDRMSRHAFFKRFSQYFDGHFKQNERGYLLNPEPFDISLEGRFNARNLLRKERNVKKKQKKK